jgi:2-polyprenyl-3-methyl-5-hydroxy-6-metoxy-1,4-benzoquinol methylase
MTFRWKIAQAAEIRWWQNYLKNKPVAEYTVWKNQYWADLLRTIGLEALLTEGGQQQRILDAGCGPAGIFTILQHHNIVALDPLLDDYEKNIPHFNKNKYPTVQFVNSPLEQFEPEAAFDYVFCLNAINHVADLSRCFDILAACTKPNGVLVVSIDAHNYRVLKKIFQKLPGDVLHPHQYDRTEYEQMLTQRHCTIEKSVLYRQHFIFNYYILIAKKR